MREPVRWGGGRGEGRGERGMCSNFGVTYSNKIWRVMCCKDNHEWLD